jgi:hypothetical protein
MVNTSYKGLGMGVLLAAVAIAGGTHLTKEKFKERDARIKAEAQLQERVRLVEYDLNTTLELQGNGKYGEAKHWFDGSWYTPPDLDASERAWFQVHADGPEQPSIWNYGDIIRIVIDDSWYETLHKNARARNPSPVDTGPGFP